MGSASGGDAPGATWRTNAAVYPERRRLAYLDPRHRAEVIVRIRHGLHYARRGQVACSGGRGGLASWSGARAEDRGCGAAAARARHRHDGRQPAAPRACLRWHPVSGPWQPARKRSCPTICPTQQPPTCGDADLNGGLQRRAEARRLCARFEPPGPGPCDRPGSCTAMARGCRYADGYCLVWRHSKTRT
jgi:hypothetical protein